MYAYSLAGMVDLDLKSVRLAQNGQIGSPSQNVLKSDLKKSQICPIWGQSDPLLAKIRHFCFLVHLFCLDNTRDYDGEW